MKNLFAIIVSCMICFSSFGQKVNLGDQTGGHFQNAPRGVITAFAPAREDKTKNIYLHDYWCEGDIFFTDSTKMSDLNIKVDLKERVLEIQYEGDVKVLPFSRMLALVFLNTQGEKEIYTTGTILFGTKDIYRDELFQIVKEGKIGLYAKIHSRVIKPNANDPLMINAGAEDKIVIEKKYFITYNEQKIEVDSKSRLKEELVNVFGSDAETSMKKVNPKKEEDLLALVSNLSNAVM